MVAKTKTKTNKKVKKMNEELLEIINYMLTKKGKKKIKNLTPSTSLRKDLGFDSMDLAEFTVRVEDKTGLDVFEDGTVDLLAEVLEKVSGL